MVGMVNYDHYNLCDHDDQSNMMIVTGLLGSWILQGLQWSEQWAGVSNHLDSPR